MPLAVVVVLSAMKDGFEDYKRQCLDNQINKQKTLAFSRPWSNSNIPFFKKTRFEYFVSRIKSWLYNAKNSSGKPTLASESDPSWTEKTWENVKVGDILLLKSDEPIPADVLILSTSEPECLCYLETKTLDGETNLKIRKGLSETSVLTDKTFSNLLQLGFSVEVK
jgi:phospholipid-translocating ATPase